MLNKFPALGLSRRKGKPGLGVGIQTKVIILQISSQTQQGVFRLYDI